MADPIKDQSNLALEAKLKKTTLYTNIIGLLVAVLTAVSIGYGFYYDTNSTLNAHSQDIKEIKSDVDEINDKVDDSAIFQSTSDTEIRHLKKQVDRIEAKQDKMIEMMAEYFVHEQPSN